MSAQIGPDVFDQPFVVSELLGDLKPQFHPDTAGIEHEVDGWTRPHLEGLGFSEERSALFLARRQPWWLILIYPHGVPDRLVAMGKVIQFMCAYDDLADDMDAAQVSDRAVSLAKMLALVTSRAPLPASDALTGMLAQAARDATADMSPEQIARFADAIKKYVESELQVVGVADAGGGFRFQEYRQFRRVNVGTPVYVRVADFLLGLSLPEEFFADPDVAEALALVSEHTAFVNDLVSFGKEIAAGRWQTNALAVWHVGEGLGLQASVDRLAAHLRDIQRELAACVDRIHTGQWADTADLDRFLTELGLMVAGDVLFEFATSRYRGDGYVWDGVTSGIATYRTSHFDIRAAASH
ncbi:terpene synthase family protein [Streptomyces sp. NPDC059003]|uniref:terpene synthase family protein n=1 Tax=Streptomyces sp. NPDC059003 TaxID=3346691 RepID=UPI0036947AA6